MKYIAKVDEVLHSGIHKWSTQIGASEFISKDMPLPDYVEIVVSVHDAMLFRYQNDGTFCGDTWHEDLQSAKAQALYEYGIPEDAWCSK
jgi:hypothetical protein